MGLKGNLETFLLSSILQLLHGDRKTGSLQVKNQEHWVSVIIQQGQIVYAMSSYRQVRLGTLLRDEGVITLEQLEQALAEGKERKIALGKVLLEKNYISLEQLTRFIRQQVEAIIYQLFFWESGEFEYEDARLNLSGLVVTQLDIMEVLLEASRRVDEMSILTKHIPNHDLIFKPSGLCSSAQIRKLAAEETRLFRLIDGRRTVQRLLEDASLIPFDGYRILHSLLMSGVIERVQGLTTATPGATSDEYSPLINCYTDILQIIWQHLEPELGQETNHLFTTCIPSAQPGQKDLFSHFNANNPGPTNAFNILENLNALKNLSNTRQFLVESFNRFILNILDRVSVLLGTHLTLTILGQIHDHLPHIKRYISDSKASSALHNDILRILELLEHQIAGKKKNKR